VSAILLPLPIIARPEPAPAQRERVALGASIAALKAATDAAEAAQEPISRLEAAIRAAAELEQEVDRLRREDQARLAAWIVSGTQTARPQPLPALIEAEKRLADVMRDATAAKEAMPRLANRAAAASDAVRVAAARRDEAAYLCAIAIVLARSVQLRDRIDAAVNGGIVHNSKNVLRRLRRMPLRHLRGTTDITGCSAASSTVLCR
jgi:hypothetical protein